MWLVLCPSNDVAAFWAYRGLGSLGLEPLELVTAEVLAISLRWEHKVGSGSQCANVDLADGRRIRGDTAFGVLNRLIHEPPLLLHNVRAADRGYASSEFAAFCLSWLNAFPGPMLNRPTPQGFSGRWRTLTEWTYLAAQAGLPTPPQSLSTSETGEGSGEGSRGTGRLVDTSEPVRTVIVVRENPVAALAPADIREGCVRLATLSKTDLLGVEFTDGPAGPWTFVGATPRPDLRLGGEALLGELARALRNGQAGAG